MRKSSSRILIETLIKNAMKGMQDDPRRSLRNLVDMALQFADGSFQLSFLEKIQTMLEDEHSAYFALLCDAFANMDHTTLITTGVNAGYNGLTIGTEKMRKVSREQGYFVPWTVMLHLDSTSFEENEQRYDEIVEQGEQLGIFTWQVFVSSPKRFFGFAQKHPNSSFALYCSAEDVTLAFLDSAAATNNLMTVLKYDESASDACVRMREAKLMYSIYYQYQESSLKELTNGDLWCDIQQHHPLFTVLVPTADCPEDFRQRVYKRVLVSRMEQRVQTILWEVERDNAYIANAIVHGGCTVSFDKYGQLLTNQGRTINESQNLFQKDLYQIFQEAYPLTKEVSHE